MFFRLGFIGVMFFKYLNGLDRRHLVLSSLWFHSEFLQFTSLGVSLICGDLFDRELINFGLKINPFGIWVHWFLKKIRVSKIYFPALRSSESLRYDLIPKQNHSLVFSLLVILIKKVLVMFTQLINNESSKKYIFNLK